MNEENKNASDRASTPNTPNAPLTNGQPTIKEGYSARRFPRKDSGARGPRSAVLRSANRAAYANNRNPTTGGAPNLAGSPAPRQGGSRPHGARGARPGKPWR
mgnify:FL=1